MRLSDLRVDGQPRPVLAVDVADAEAELGFPFPPGYAELMTRLGPGSVFGQVRVAGPRQVLADRGFAQGNYGWFVEDDPDRPLGVVNAPGEAWPARDLLDLVYLGYGGPNSGCLLLHPGRPGRVYAIHRDQYGNGGPDDVVHFAGADLLGRDLLALHGWECQPLG